MNCEQRIEILHGARQIAKALDISPNEVFAALCKQGNITPMESFALMISEEREKGEKVNGD